MTISNKSSWREASPHKSFPALETALNVDVAIIGGGITGITAAYLLRATGTSVALFERDRIGNWATGSTTGFLMEIPDTDASKLTSRYGEEKARLIIASHRDAVSCIEHIVLAENIECAFTRCPVYIYARSEKEAEDIQKEVTALARTGTTAIFSRDSALTLRNSGYLKIERQAKFHPLKYVSALAAACEKAGIRIFEQTEVTKIEEGATHILHTKSGRIIHAAHVLEATHYPLSPQPSQLRFKKAWYTTYVLEASLPKNSLPEALFEDLATPYHYARVDAGASRDRLIIGGEDHRSDVKVNEKKNFDALEMYLKEILPSVQYEITRKWKGRIVESGDGIAYIGRTTNHSVFYATGYSGNGLTYGTITAQLFRDHVLENPNPLASIYSPKRGFSLRTYVPKALEYFQIFMGGAIKNTIFH